LAEFDGLKARMSKERRHSWLEILDRRQLLEGHLRHAIGHRQGIEHGGFLVEGRQLNSRYCQAWKKDRSQSACMIIDRLNREEKTIDQIEWIIKINNDSLFVHGGSSLPVIIACSCQNDLFTTAYPRNLDWNWIRRQIFLRRDIGSFLLFFLLFAEDGRNRRPYDLLLEARFCSS